VNFTKEKKEKSILSVTKTLENVFAETLNRTPSQNECVNWGSWPNFLHFCLKKFYKGRTDPETTGLVVLLTQQSNWQLSVVAENNIIFLFGQKSKISYLPTFLPKNRQ
jgi:hypothetical protein